MVKTEQLSQRAINWDTEPTRSCGLGGGPCATSTGSEPQPAPCPAVTGENQADLMEFVPDKLTGADSPFLVGVLVIAKVAGSGLEAQQDTIEC